MAVGEQDQRLDELGQGPAVLASLQQGLDGRERERNALSGCPWLPGPAGCPRDPSSLCLSYLDMLLGDEPRPMRQ